MHAFLTFLPKLTHAAARSLCDSWASCYFLWSQIDTDRHAIRHNTGFARWLISLNMCRCWETDWSTHVTEWFAGNDVVSGRIALHEASFCETQRTADWVRGPRTDLLHCELCARCQRFIGAVSNRQTDRQM